jgi:N-acetylglutamate synthase-like GNAT family acetyltransferase
MSEIDDALREMAVNRGCKLQRSRRRKPGGDFGRYGLKDAKTGAEILGFGPKELTATADEIRDFLRGGAIAGWKSSLRAAGKLEKRQRRKSGNRKTEESPTAGPEKREPEVGREPKEPKEPRESKAPKKPNETKPVKLAIREARPKDAEAIAALVSTLGYDMAVADIRRRLVKLRKKDESALVADRGGVVGCLSWHVTPVLHRPRPVGRITMMVVAENVRGEGVGAALVEAAEARLRKRGCGLIEVTSNMKRMRAHDFYEGVGFERTAYRFAKTIAD